MMKFSGRFTFKHRLKTIVLPSSTKGIGGYIFYIYSPDEQVANDGSSHGMYHISSIRNRLD